MLGQIHSKVAFLETVTLQLASTIITKRLVYSTNLRRNVAQQIKFPSNQVKLVATGVAINLGLQDVAFHHGQESPTNPLRIDTRLALMSK